MPRKPPKPLLVIKVWGHFDSGEANSITLHEWQDEDHKYIDLLFRADILMDVAQMVEVEHLKAADTFQKQVETTKKKLKA